MYLCGLQGPSQHCMCSSHVWWAYRETNSQFILWKIQLLGTLRQSENSRNASLSVIFWPRVQLAETFSSHFGLPLRKWQQKTAVGSKGAKKYNLLGIGRKEVSEPALSTQLTAQLLKTNAIPNQPGMCPPPAWLLSKFMRDSKENKWQMWRSGVCVPICQLSWVILVSASHKELQECLLLSLIIFGLERTEAFCIMYGFFLNYKYAVTADFPITSVYTLISA